MLLPTITARCRYSLIGTSLRFSIMGRMVRSDLARAADSANCVENAVIRDEGIHVSGGFLSLRSFPLAQARDGTGLENIGKVVAIDRSHPRS